MKKLSVSEMKSVKGGCNGGSTCGGWPCAYCPYYYGSSSGGSTTYSGGGGGVPYPSNPPYVPPGG